MHTTPNEGTSLLTVFFLGDAFFFLGDAFFFAAFLVALPAVFSPPFSGALVFDSASSPSLAARDAARLVLVDIV